MPSDGADEIISFDGSVTIRRARGELWAECHAEPANDLAINPLEDDKSVAEARDGYAETPSPEGGRRYAHLHGGFDVDLPTGG